MHSLCALSVQKPMCATAQLPNLPFLSLMPCFIWKKREDSEHKRMKDISRWKSGVSSDWLKMKYFGRKWKVKQSWTCKFNLSKWTEYWIENGLNKVKSRKVFKGGKEWPGMKAKSNERIFEHWTQNLICWKLSFEPTFGRSLHAVQRFHCILQVQIDWLRGGIIQLCGFGSPVTLLVNKGDECGKKK